MIPADVLARLGDPSFRARHDASSYADLIERLPAQARDAWALGHKADVSGVEAARSQHGESWPRRVFVVGVGGSAIGADVAATVSERLTGTPISVVRNYSPPPLDAGALVMLCSFSGNTEEVLEVLDLVAASEATAVAITTGGLLLESAQAHGIDTIRYSWPGPPRSGLGYGAFIPLALLRRLGVIAIRDDEIAESFEALDRAVAAWGPHAHGSLAQELANWLTGGVPAVIGADFLEVAARRWAGELSENAKQLAAAYGIPEFNHNQLEPSAGNGVEIGPLRFVILDADPVHERNRMRVERTAAMLVAAGREVRVVHAGGTSPLAAILTASSLGSWTSYYLALLRGVDPARSTILDQLKQRLADER